MNAKRMFLSLVPWLLFTVMIGRRGDQAAGIAALAAAALAAVFVVKNSAGGLKVIDVTGVATFGSLAAACFLGGLTVTDWVAHYGRGTSALVLAAVMLGSTLVTPFTEQYARETVPQQYWATPEFRSVNRRISAVWGAVMLLMGGGHLAAGALNGLSEPAASITDLLLNWAVPAVLILAGVTLTHRLSGTDSSNQPAPSVGSVRSSR